MNEYLIITKLGESYKIQAKTISIAIEEFENTEHIKEQNIRSITELE